MLEMVKDRWNAELERNVRQLQTTDWDGVRLRLEDGISGLWSRAFQKGREVVPDPPKVL
jgi:altered-inheritance-of-mitochondria protein 5